MKNTLKMRLLYGGIMVSLALAQTDEAQAIKTGKFTQVFATSEAPRPTIAVRTYMPVEYMSLEERAAHPTLAESEFVSTDLTQGFTAYEFSNITTALASGDAPEGTSIEAGGVVKSNGVVVGSVDELVVAAGQLFREAIRIPVEPVLEHADLDELVSFEGAAALPPHPFGLHPIADDTDFTPEMLGNKGFTFDGENVLYQGREIGSLSAFRAIPDADAREGFRIVRPAFMEVPTIETVTAIEEGTATPITPQTLPAHARITEIGEEEYVEFGSLSLAADDPTTLFRFNGRLTAGRLPRENLFMQPGGHLLFQIPELRILEAAEGFDLEGTDLEGHTAVDLNTLRPSFTQIAVTEEDTIRYGSLNLGVPADEFTLYQEDDEGSFVGTRRIAAQPAIEEVTLEYSHVHLTIRELAEQGFRQITTETALPAHFKLIEGDLYYGDLTRVGQRNEYALNSDGDIFAIRSIRSFNSLLSDTTETDYVVAEGDRLLDTYTRLSDVAAERLPEDIAIGEDGVITYNGHSTGKTAAEIAIDQYGNYYEISAHTIPNFEETYMGRPLYTQTADQTATDYAADNDDVRLFSRTVADQMRLASGHMELSENNLTYAGRHVATLREFLVTGHGEETRLHSLIHLPEMGEPTRVVNLDVEVGRRVTEEGAFEGVNLGEHYHVDGETLFFGDIDLGAANQYRITEDSQLIKLEAREDASRFARLMIEQGADVPADVFAPLAAENCPEGYRVEGGHLFYGASDLGEIANRFFVQGGQILELPEEDQRPAPVAVDSLPLQSFVDVEGGLAAAGLRSLQAEGVGLPENWSVNEAGQLLHAHTVKGGAADFALDAEGQIVRLNRVAMVNLEGWREVTVVEDRLADAGLTALTAENLPEGYDLYEGNLRFYNVALGAAEGFARETEGERNLVRINRVGMPDTDGLTVVTAAEGHLGDAGVTALTADNLPEGYTVDGDGHLRFHGVLIAEGDAANAENFAVRTEGGVLVALHTEDMPTFDAANTVTAVIGHLEDAGVAALTEENLPAGYTIGEDGKVHFHGALIAEEDAANAENFAVRTEGGALVALHTEDMPTFDAASTVTAVIDHLEDAGVAALTADNLPEGYTIDGEGHLRFHGALIAEGDDANAENFAVRTEDGALVALHTEDMPTFDAANTVTAVIGHLEDAGVAALTEENLPAGYTIGEDGKVRFHGVLIAEEDAANAENFALHEERLVRLNRVDAIDVDSLDSAGYALQYLAYQIVEDDAERVLPIEVPTTTEGEGEDAVAAPTVLNAETGLEVRADGHVYQAGRDLGEASQFGMRGGSLVKLLPELPVTLYGAQEDLAAAGVGEAISTEALPTDAAVPIEGSTNLTIRFYDAGEASRSGFKVYYGNTPLGRLDDIRLIKDEGGNVTGIAKAVEGVVIDYRTLSLGSVWSGEGAPEASIIPRDSLPSFGTVATDEEADVSLQVDGGKNIALPGITPEGQIVRILSIPSRHPADTPTPDNLHEITQERIDAYGDVLDKLTIRDGTHLYLDGYHLGDVRDFRLEYASAADTPKLVYFDPEIAHSSDRDPTSENHGVLAGYGLNAARTGLVIHATDEDVGPFNNHMIAAGGYYKLSDITVAEEADEDGEVKHTLKFAPVIDTLPLLAPKEIWLTEDSGLSLQLGEQGKFTLVARYSVGEVTRTYEWPAFYASTYDRGKMAVGVLVIDRRTPHRFGVNSKGDLFKMNAEGGFKALDTKITNPEIYAGQTMVEEERYPPEGYLLSLLEDADVGESVDGDAGSDADSQ